MTFDELFRVFRLTEQCRKQTPPEGRRNFLMLFSLMNSIFDYSVIRFLSARARRSFAKSGRYNINQLRMALVRVGLRQNNYIFIDFITARRRREKIAL